MTTYKLQDACQPLRDRIAELEQEVEAITNQRDTAFSMRDDYEVQNTKLNRIIAQQAASIEALIEESSN